MGIVDQLLESQIVDVKLKCFLSDLEQHAGHGIPSGKPER